MIEIPTVASLLAQQNQEAFDKNVLSVIRDIERAVARGDRKTCFNPPDGDRFYAAVKAAFLKKGYLFAPTGCVGGVWQRTENIHW